MSLHTGLDRRRFLRGAGVALALPLLEGRMSRAGAWAGEPMPRRLVCIGNHLGFWPQGFFPSGEADSLAISPTLAPLAAHRERLTVFSHLDHAVRGGHAAVHAFLSGIKKSESAGFGEKNVSLDQIDELLSVLSVSTKGISYSRHSS